MTVVSETKDGNCCCPESSSSPSSSSESSSSVAAVGGLPGTGPSSCPGGQPELIMTISGMCGTWMGFGNGVHTICPTFYEITPDESEKWFFSGFGSAFDFGQLLFYASALGTYSRMQAYGLYPTPCATPTAGNPTTYFGPSYFLTILGFVRSRLFTTIAWRGATITFEQGGGWSGL